MKKIAKIVIILLMLIGIAFSISNFFLIEAKATDEVKVTNEIKGSDENGAWEYFSNGTKQCIAPGTACKTGDAFAPNI